jgi:hypothetical protein
MKLFFREEKREGGEEEKTIRGQRGKESHSGSRGVPGGR